MADAVAAQGKPLVVQTIYPDSPRARCCGPSGIPVHRDVDRACAVLAGLVEPARPASPRSSRPPRRPSPTRRTTPRGRCSPRPASPSPVACRSRTPLGSRPRSRTCRFPVVLKAEGRLHKSEGGGVVLGLVGRDAARAAYDDLVARLAPPAVSVEEMADLADGVELIVGSVRDPKFGAVVMVGLGGIFTEVLGDTACAIAPVSAAAARELLLSLQGAPVLLGARGRAPVDLDALAEVVARVSRLAAAHPELVELELNPVLAGPAGVLALDARVVCELRADVAQVALVEVVDPGVLGREDAVVERPRGDAALDALARLVVLLGHALVELHDRRRVEVGVLQRLGAEEVLRHQPAALRAGREHRGGQAAGPVDVEEHRGVDQRAVVGLRVAAPVLNPGSSGSRRRGSSTIAVRPSASETPPSERPSSKMLPFLYAGTTATSSGWIVGQCRHSL